MHKKYNLPDVKAPRFRENGHNVFTKEFFDNFYSRYPKLKKYSRSDIKNIVKKFNELMWETAIEFRDGVQFPEGIGMIFIGTCQKAISKNIDHVKSKKYGIAVSNTNWETDGKLAKIFYTSYISKYKFEFRHCWGFRGCRNFKRSVAKTYPENWTMYLQVDPVKKLREEYTREKRKRYFRSIRDKEIKEYNEFDL
jgi:hypothetical protein